MADGTTSDQCVFDSYGIYLVYTVCETQGENSMEELPQDWQDFYQQLGLGATFGLFDLPVVGNQPVLLIHAAPNMQVPRQAVLGSTLELQKWEGVYIVRMCVAIQAEVPLLRNYEEFLLSYHDQPRRSTQHCAFVFKPQEALRFEAFLNPVDGEDRLILQKLEHIPGLYISVVRSGKILWGKQFPWPEAARSAVRQILEETQETSSLGKQAWERAKEWMMENSTL
jgi:hypothetical protein